MNLLFKLIPLAFVASFLSACVQQYNLRSSFEPREAAWINRTGSASIDGEAFMRTVGGDIRTCAGLNASLVPVTSYSTERILYLYHNNEKGFTPAGFGNSVNFSNEDKRYYDYTRQVPCNSAGNFIFKNLPNGNYYLSAPVIWKSDPNSIYFDGGFLMQKITISNGRKEKVILTY